VSRAKRPKLVSFVAGWLIVCSAVGALVFSIVIPSVTSIQTDGELAQSIVAALGRYGLLTVTLVVYAFAGATGYGLWTLRRWGWVALMAASTLLVTVCIVVGAQSAFRAHVFDWAAWINSLVFDWHLYYFNRRRIKGLFV